jgi:NADPH:quinone reductase-like Zn-dependent oxidoreductase
MIAAVLHAPGPPDAFVLEELPRPVPRFDEALVKVEACGVSSRDVAERKGLYRRDVSFPLVLGLEIAGVVAEVGPQVRALRIGDRVCSKAFSSCGDCRYCRTGRESTCRSRSPVRGGYGEFTVVPEDALVRVPETISFNQACSLGPATGVALNAVRDVARVQLGDIVLVTGATGGVGLPAVQLAKLAGARVLALTRSKNKQPFLEEAGADEVIVAGDGEGFSNLVREKTANEGVDVVIDTVGSGVFTEGFKSLALHGRYAFVGQLKGEEISINPARIFFKRAQLLGVGSVSRGQLEDVIRLTAGGRLNPKVGAVLPLRRIAEAHRLVEEGTVLGRVVVQP